MNALETRGYSSALTQVETDREAEARLLSRLNADLARSASDVARNYPAFTRALHANERFWVQLATDLAHDDNRLPGEMRAALISLAGFVIAHSAKVRSGAASAQALTDLNLAIIRGLSGQERIG
ncbi:flagellar biosynthesis regulator FlaF [Paracoccus sediminicola]|uniref:flagellar biosynthesis regulator FlaF n=1 Tax=Paracoccus sediminicola TaxID=3017783 RepID=UPI0022F116AC|nr:flagellar biosynthesis regulator FlaF [Paracoccus sediminicola]WBU56884.1 flagellar biosynthesis regulator FlaF [Paracoccus sediminicola]